MRIGRKIKLLDAYTGKEKLIHKANILTGHGGGDDKLMAFFIKNAREKNQESLSEGSEALESHLMAFASDISRIEDRVVEMKELR